MGLPPDVGAALHALASAAGTDRDLASGLQQLLELATRAVPSCLAVSLTVASGLMPVTVVVLSPLGAAGLPVLSSLAVRLPTVAGTQIGVSRALTLYAAAPGSLVSMAADLLALLDLDPRRAMLDGHLELPPESELGTELTGRLEEMVDVDRALGVLLDRGLLPDEGRRELERLAAHHTLSIPAVARLVLNTVQRPPTQDRDQPPD